MRIAVLNGSPKGDLSITKRYVDFLSIRFPSDSFVFLNISENIKKIEKDENYLNLILCEIEKSDAVLWAFPVYYLLVPSQYKRFIEIIFENSRTKPFKDKYTAAISTSIHYFDNTAHNYIQAVSDDLEMRYTGFFSAKMEDLLNEEKRNSLFTFWKMFGESVSQQKETGKYYAALNYQNKKYLPSATKNKTDLFKKKAIILTDAESPDSNAMKMSEKLRDSFSGAAEIINIQNLALKGGCLGCIRCSYDNKCIYKDGFSEWFSTVLMSADIVIMSCTIKDRFISSMWKQFLDRSFFMGHIPYLSEKTAGIMISGPYSRIENLKEFFEAFLEMSRCYPAGIISDESENPKITDRLIEDFSKNIAFVSENRYRPPETFLAAAGRKIFRDEISGSLRPIFRADDRYYKKNRLYDFPQKNYCERVKNQAMIILFSVPYVRKRVLPRFKDYMVKPYDNILKKL